MSSDGVCLDVTSKQTEGYLSEPTMCIESAAGYGIRVVLFPSDHLNLDL